MLSAETDNKISFIDKNNEMSSATNANAKNTTAGTACSVKMNAKHKVQQNKLAIPKACMFFIIITLRFSVRICSYNAGFSNSR
jgi:azurin